MSWYHASPTELTMSDLRDTSLCLADDPDAAMEYARNGHLYEVTYKGRIANPSLVTPLARELHPHHGYASTWEQIEQLAGVRDALVEMGYDGVRYLDMTPDNRTLHDTIVLFNASECVTGLTELEP